MSHKKSNLSFKNTMIFMTYRLSHVQFRYTIFNHRDQRNQVRVPDRHSIGRLPYGWWQLYAVNVTGRREDMVFFPNLSDFQRIIMINVRHGSLVLKIRHQTTSPDRAFLDVVVRHVQKSIFQLSIFQIGELHQLHDQINLWLSAHEHRLYCRTAVAGQFCRRSCVLLLLEYELVICNKFRDKVIDIVVNLSTFNVFHVNYIYVEYESR